MNATNELLDKPNAVLPSKRDAELAAESSRSLSAVAQGNGEFRVQLEGGQELILPSAVRTLLVHLLTEMSRGNAVTIVPIHAELTTQEAADFLNVSRPHIIKLLERGEIRFHMTGTHRRIRFEDLAEFKRRQDIRRDQAMKDLAEQAQALGLGY